MTEALDRRWWWIFAAAGLVVLLLGPGVGRARAAVYPNGGSTFSGSLEGWQATKDECKVLGVTELEALCRNESGLDATSGNPAGSLAAKGKVLVDVGGSFKSDTSFESPTFTAGEGGQGSLALDRAFDPGGLVELKPQLTYTATLVDKTSGQRQEAISETVGATAPFARKSGAVSLVAGHQYAVVIEAEIEATLVGASLGAATGRFDNVSVTGPGAGSGAGGGGNGGGEENNTSALTDARLESLLGSSLTGSAGVKGNRVFVKARCPAKVGAACRVTVRGLLKKGKPATAPRTAKIAKGKSKLLALGLKPKLKGVVAKRKKLLFKETVRAAKAKATVYRKLKLIRR